MNTSHPAISTPPAALRFGFWSAILTALFATITFGVASTTLPISGPYCQVDCVTYPFQAVAANVPHDYLWIYPAILLAPIFLLLMVSLHSLAAPDKKWFSQAALMFALAYAAIMSANYFIQVETMQPSLLNGETEGLALYSQYNGHGIFIALENLGYLAMSLAFFFTAWVFVGKTKLEKTIRRLLWISPALALLGLILYSAIYGFNVEYRFEVFIITVNYLTLIISGILMSIHFKRIKLE